MGINVLGPLTVDGPGRLGPHDRVVLQALATRLGQPVRADELVDAVWGEHPPASAHKNLQSCIVRLRKVLGTQAIETSSHGYVLAVPPDDLDAHDFEARVHRARALLAVGENDRVAFLLEQALARWRGPAFADLPEWPPARTEAGRLDELRLEAQEMHVDAMLRSGRAREALGEAHALVRAAPLRERRWELLVLAQYQTGAQGEALRSLRQLRAVLARELGIDPSPEMVALERSILNQDPNLMAPKPRTGTGECPWQGLKAYDVDDADRFFGRSRDVQACLDLLAAGSFAALVGPSGSGKSSIMRAGVLAALRERGRPIVLVTPTARPIDALTALPEDADERAVLAVDQTEEVFTLCDDPDERRDFLDRLAREVARRPVVVTLRGDRLTQVTEHPEFSRLVERSLQLVGALDEDALREAITGPAQMAGLVLQPGLVDLLVREVRDDPGALPLLSHALQETWRRREGNTMTVDGYHASGGIHGAVAQSAEHLYASTPPDQRHLLRDLLLRLVSPGGEGEAVRTQVPRRLIAADEPHEQLVAMLVDARLVTSDAGVLEITHEALARAWPRLRGWLEDDIEGQRIRHHLSGAADAWDTLGRPDSELYRGVRLTRALDWRSRTDSALTDVERDFLDASRVQAEIEEQTAAERARAQARLIRRLRIVLGGAVVLLALALAAGGVAAVQSDRASENATRAEQAAVSADARRVGARSQLTDDIGLSLLLAAAGVRLDDSPETRVNLMTALDRQPQLIRSSQPGGNYLEGMDVSHDGRWIASSDDQNRMHLYDAATNRLLRSYDAGQPAANQQAWLIGAFSPDSSQLAVTLTAVPSTEPVRLLDPETMQVTATALASPSGKPVIGTDVQFSADGRYLGATILDSSSIDPLARSFAAIWDLRSPSTPPVRVPAGTSGQGLALSPDGQTLYTAWPLTARDVATGKRIWRRKDVTSWLALDINADGTLLALADDASGRDALLVDAADGSTVARLRGHQALVRDIRFSPDGKVVGSASDDGELIVWNIPTGRPRTRWDTFDPWGVGFSPDNDVVHGGGGSDSMLRTWDLSGRATYLRRTTQVVDVEKFTHADLSPDGQQAAYSWVDGEDRGWVRFVDTVTGDATPPARFPVWEGEWFNVVDAWHPDGGQYAGYWCDDNGCAKPGTVTIVDAVTGRPLRSTQDLLGGRGDIESLAYVDEGGSLLAGHVDGTTSLLDAATLLPTAEPFDVSAMCCTTPLGDDSTAMVYAWSADAGFTHWRVLDLGTGEVLSEGKVDLFAQASVASPDGSTVAVTGDTGEIITLDIRTGAQQRSAGLGANVLWLDYSGDGKLLVSGAEDGGVSLWDASTLDLLGTVHPPRRGKAVPAGVQFVGDTHDVTIASYDGRVYRWDTDLDRALAFACQMAGRDLTREEWAEVLPAQPYESVCPQD
ncbi:BTAD domain-containing putative transcriptional regulator [Nocardioides sp. STR2]|uniref:BTAD domain-containing putative transcriptional regulator n=1 Tax=Nocardioides pini TaxID=2975053 RepID=A0ABT4C8F4_9ACTN|nr:BTAD domain-containing putative transcriptional regulator [Nocardioides pini]